MAKVEFGFRSKAIREFLSATPKATVKEVVDGLKQKGIEVKEGLVNAVKYGKKGKKRAKKAAPSTNGKAVTGSESIRQYLAKHPGAAHKEIVKGLKQDGVKVSLSLVSAVKYGKGKKAGKKSRVVSVRVAARATPASSLTIEQLLEVKRFVDSFGGAEQISKALDTLERLR